MASLQDVVCGIKSCTIISKILLTSLPDESKLVRTNVHPFSGKLGQLVVWLVSRRQNVPVKFFLAFIAWNFF